MAEQMKLSLGDMLNMADRWGSAATKMQQQISTMTDETVHSVGVAGDLAGGTGAGTSMSIRAR